MVRINAGGVGMADFAHTYDLGTSKESSPPLLMDLSGDWIGENYELTGRWSDPDGDSVSITATNSEDGGENFSWAEPIEFYAGQTWRAFGPGIPDSDSNTIVLTVCDNWGKCSTQSHEAGATPGEQDDEPVSPPVSDSEGSDDGLAVAGFIIAIVALVIVIIAVVAMVLLGRRK